MLWEPLNEDCGVCECSSIIKAGCQLPESPCDSFHNASCDGKNTIQQHLGHSPLKHESDLSLYSNSSPERPMCHDFSLSCYTKQKRTLEDHNTNSQDSGYSPSYVGDGNKLYAYNQSSCFTSRHDCSPKSCYRSFGSMDSMDDAFLELTDLEQPLDENIPLPNDFDSLITDSFTTSRYSKDVTPKSDSFRPQLQRSQSCNVEHTPVSSRVRSCLFKRDDVEHRSFKRPEPPIESERFLHSKRTKIEDESDHESQLAAVPKYTKPVLRRSISATEESIKYALQRSSTEPDLIGDFTKSFCLPLTSGRHQDLKSITPTTLALLMRGDYNNTVASYKVIDCRYPYEYDGGHIDGATNLYTKDQILEHLLNSKTFPVSSSDSRKRNLLVFHCEFSSERGPNLYRFLRKLDRLRNSDVYPALHYPEMYLLEGGYKNFYEEYSELCIPEAYKPMLHPEHSSDLRHFRAKSKSWNFDRLRPAHKGNLKHLGFM